MRSSVGDAIFQFENVVFISISKIANYVIYPLHLLYAFEYNRAPFWIWVGAYD